MQISLSSFQLQKIWAKTLEFWILEGESASMVNNIIIISSSIINNNSNSNSTSNQQPATTTATATATSSSSSSSSSSWQADTVGLTYSAQGCVGQMQSFWSTKICTDLLSRHHWLKGSKVASRHRNPRNLGQDKVPSKEGWFATVTCTLIDGTCCDPSTAVTGIFSIVCQASMPHSSQVVQPAGFMVYFMLARCLFYLR